MGRSRGAGGRSGPRPVRAGGRRAGRRTVRRRWRRAARRPGSAGRRSPAGWPRSDRRRRGAAGAPAGEGRAGRSGGGPRTGCRRGPGRRRSAGPGSGAAVRARRGCPVPQAPSVARAGMVPTARCVIQTTRGPPTSCSASAASVPSVTVVTRGPVDQRRAEAPRCASSAELTRSAAACDGSYWTVDLTRPRAVRPVPPVVRARSRSDHRERPVGHRRRCPRMRPAGSAGLADGTAGWQHATRPTPSAPAASRATPGYRHHRRPGCPGRHPALSGLRHSPVFERDRSAAPRISSADLLNRPRGRRNPPPKESVVRERIRWHCSAGVP
jgi:hypothetical protein